MIETEKSRKKWQEDHEAAKQELRDIDFQGKLPQIEGSHQLDKPVKKEKKKSWGRKKK